ncbi:MAG: cytochrome b/b6 domain-containing protein [Acidimicrobiales bacterium]
MSRSSDPIASAPARSVTGTVARSRDSSGHRTEQSDEAGTDRLPRFTVAERWLHWATAALVLTCAVTGLILYIGELSALVGRRDVLKDVHVYAGLLLPVPLVLAYAGRWRRAVRRDVRQLARWSPDDKAWLRSLGRRAGDQVGKFNAGQKANAAFVAGLIPVMLATGSIMRWFEPFPLSWRTGATFVHDWTAIATWVVVTGHILVAVSRPPALRAMIVGWVPASWARDHHPAWPPADEAADESSLAGTR